MRILSIVAFLVFAAGIAFSPPGAEADPLSLDSTFGAGGKVMRDFQLAPGFSQDNASAVAVQTDGKIVLAGTVYNGATGTYDFGLARFNPNGSPDLSFGGAGVVATDFSGRDDSGYGVAIQSDGKLVVAGESSDPATGNSDFALARYNADGTPDTGFGGAGTGQVLTDLGVYDSWRGVALQADGKIVVAGQHKPNPDASDIAVGRYLQGGSLDPSFNATGIVLTDIGMWEIGWDLALQQDDKAVVVGSSWGPNFNPVRGVLARYLADGTLDSSFGTAGRVLTNLGNGGFDYGVAVALRRADGSEDGRIVIAGQFGVARFNADGGLDSGFSDDGIMDDSSNTGAAVAIRGDGRILVAGQRAGDFGLALYNSSGNLATHCSAAEIATDFAGHGDSATAMAFQSDGKLVVGGFADSGTDWDFAAARYRGSGCSFRRLNRYFVAYHIFVHPQDEVGPPYPDGDPIPGYRLGGSRLFLAPASAGSELEAGSGPALQSYELRAVGRAQAAPGRSRLRVTNELGESVIDALQPDSLLVPAAYSVGEPRGTLSEARDLHHYQCSKARAVGEPAAGSGEKRVTVTDALNRSQVFGVGKPTQVCEPIGAGGGELSEPAPHLVCYEGSASGAAAAAGKRAASVRTANRFGMRTLRVAEPAALCLPSLVSE